MKEMSNKQKDTLTLIGEFINKNGVAPTMQNIADHFEITASSAHQRVAALVARGYVTSGNHQNRSVSITDKAPLRFQI